MKERIRREYEYACVTSRTHDLFGYMGDVIEAELGLSARNDWDADPAAYASMAPDWAEGWLAN